jgi:hypothetical protein
MIQKLLGAAVIAIVTLAGNASSAGADPITFNVIGQFSLDDPGTGPTFTFENLSGGALENLSLELQTDQGEAFFGFTTTLGIDTNGDGIDDQFVASPIIPDGASALISDDLSGFAILQAFIRAPGSILVLLDPNGDPLLDALGAPRGLDGVLLTSAQVGVEAAPAPVPEPSTALLVAGGLAAAFFQRRRARRGIETPSKAVSSLPRPAATPT